jgi:hypothetical protein
MRTTPPELHLYADVTSAQLLQPDMTADATQFAMLTLSWLAHLLRSGDASAAGARGSSGSSSLFGSIPESVLGDAASWLTFVVRQQQADQLTAAGNLGHLMLALVTVLEHPEQVCVRVCASVPCVFGGGSAGGGGGGGGWPGYGGRGRQ